MSNDLCAIGEFSKITGLSVKTLRFYDEQGLLKPTTVDQSSGYRYYDAGKAEQARVIRHLREMDFSIEEIAAMFAECADEADILHFLDHQKAKLAQRIRREREAVRALDAILARERAVRQLSEQAARVVEKKTLPPLLMAGVRMRGKYSDCGQGFAKIGRALGRHLAGPPFCLYYDGEYREDDADFEACFPLKREAQAEGIAVRTLPGGDCLTLVHRGPYDQLGRSYEKILRHARAQNSGIALPTREIYLKGPGMIFKGNPDNYLTEIQLPLER